MWKLYKYLKTHISIIFDVNTTRQSEKKRKWNGKKPSKKNEKRSVQFTRQTQRNIIVITFQRERQKVRFIERPNCKRQLTPVKAGVNFDIYTARSFFSFHPKTHSRRDRNKSLLHYAHGLINSMNT